MPTDRFTRNDTRASRRLRWLAGATLAAGCALSLGAWRVGLDRQARALRTGFDSEARHLAGAVEREINLFTSVLVSLGELHTLSERISVSDFDEFARKGLLYQHEILGSFCFAQRIPLDVRAVMESEAYGTNALRIVERARAGGLQSAVLRPEYYPLTYQNPAGTLGLPEGFDLASLPGNREAIDRMAASGRPALGAMLNDPAQPDRTGFLVCAPILAAQTGDGQPPLALSGFTAAVLWPQEMMTRALGKTLIRDLQVTLYDPAYHAPEQDGATKLFFEQPLAMVDQTWTFRCEAAPDYLHAHGSPLPWLALAAGLAITALLTLQISLLAARTALIERTVQERTAELSEANRKLGEEMTERLRLEHELHDATAREKQRIGHDLHDSLGQKLTGAVFLSKALAAQIPEQDAEARESARRINEILKDAVAQVRRTARGLAPVDVGEDGLAHALRRLANETCDVYNIACSFRSEGDIGIKDPQTATHIYHIAQEAVSNAVRHGEPREITIRLTLAHAHGQLVVEDNGKGFAGQRSAGGAGLRIMRHRAKTIGGALDIAANPGGGARIVCDFPLA